MCFKDWEEGFEDGSKMMEGIFTTLENKTHIINLFLTCHLCVLLHFHPMQPQVRYRINNNKLALFSWIFSTCIGEHAFVLSKRYY
jgi:hypothetical protein